MKNSVKKLWDLFWAGGSDTESVSIIEQITYLMFIHDLDDMDIDGIETSNLLGIPYESKFVGSFSSEENNIVWDKHDFKWSVFKDMNPERMFATVRDGVFPFIKTLHGEKDSAFSKFMADAKFTIPNPVMFTRVVDNLDEIYEIIERENNNDVRGDLYEYLLGELSTQKKNGQFRTPRHIIRLMVDLMQPNTDDVIADPACGTGGFLITAAEYLTEHHQDKLREDSVLYHYNNSMFSGFDKDPHMIRIAAMNMMLHRIENPDIVHRNSLEDDYVIDDKYSLILANPPFTGKITDKILVKPDLLTITDCTKTELLFLSLMVKLLRVGGRCAVIVPEGVLFWETKAAISIKKEIVDKNQLIAAITLPKGVFLPYSDVSTSILIFNKTGCGGTDKVWFYNMESDGFTLDTRHDPIDDNDIPDVLNRYFNLDNEVGRTRLDKSFMVSKDEIVEHNYNLTFKEYKEIVIKEIQYRPPSEILDDIISNTEKTIQSLKQFKDLI
ncbi:MAG: SAM-dependent DNA methyltransferase [Thermoplasmata archaeon]|nr:SAM-dependent DNA methyltransferase [Thermoplasmata archaeon]